MFGPLGDFRTTGCELKVRLSKKYSVSHVGIYLTKEPAVNPPKIKVSGEAGETFLFEVSDKMSQYILIKLPTHLTTAVITFEIVSPILTRGGLAALQISQLEVWAGASPACNTQVESTHQERKEGALEQVRMHWDLRAVSSVYRGD